MTSRDQSGAASIEFAIVGLVFVTLLMLAVDTGWQALTEAALGAGARAASRFGSTGSAVAQGINPAPVNRNASITDVVIQASGGLLLAPQLQVTMASYASFPALAAGGASTPGPGNAGQVVQYTFTYTQPYLTPVAVTITGHQQMVHSVQVTVLNEPFPAD